MNRIRRKLQTKAVCNGLIVQEARRDLVFRVLAHSGFDSVIIDMEHGTFSLDETARVCHICNLVDMTPLVRIIDHSYASVARALDAGAAGIVLPRVITADEVREAVRYAKYPPDGLRGISSQRGQAQYLPVPSRAGYVAQQNAETLIVVQIEQVEALQNLEEILAVPGIDIALVGPSDLGMSMGGLDYSSSEMQQAIDRVIETGRQHGVEVGIAISDIDKLRACHEKGMRYLVKGSDVALLTDAFADAGGRLAALHQ